MTKKQQQVPGTELPEIEALTEASEAYRKTVAERMSLQKIEADQKAHLIATVHRLIDEGSITLKETTSGEPQIIYRYEDEDGKTRDVKFAHGKETVKVNISSIHAGDDD